jgi:DNA-binding transcriptional LysR family regulator
LAKAAVAGLGITVIPAYAVRDHIATGALVTVLPRYHVAPRPLLAVYPRTPTVPRKLQVFVEFLRTWMAEQDLDVVSAAAE